MKKKSFVVRAAASALATLVAVGMVTLAFLYLSNELYSFGDAARTTKDVLWGPGFSQFDAHYKLIRSGEKNPQILTLGSSRANQFRAEMFPGSSFYNAAGVARFEMIRHFLEELYKTHKPEVLIVTVDPWWMRPLTKDDLRTPQEFSWTQTLEVAARRMSDPVYVRSILFNRPAMQKDPVGGRETIGYRARWHGDGYRPDGSVQYGGFLRKTDPYYELYKYGYDQGFEYFIRAVREQRGRFGYVGPIAPESTSALDNLLLSNSQAGVKTILVLPPFASALYRAIQTVPAQKDFLRRFVDSLRQRADRFGVEVFDFQNLSDLGMDDSQTIDAIHADEVSYLKMVQTLAHRSRVLGPVVDVDELDRRQQRFTDAANRPRYNLIAR